MTIAQALRRVKKCKGKMAELTARATASVSYEADQKPTFNFAATRDEIARVREELVTLEAAVAKANATNMVTFDGASMTLAEAIRRLQECKAEMVWLQHLHIRDGVERHPEVDYDATTGRPVRRTHEVVYLSDLKETARVAELDALRDRFERLNDAVETANHKTPVDWNEPAPAQKAA